MTDTQFYKEIWEERPHRCIECGEPLRVFMAINFSHILTKKSYPSYRHDKRNIDLLCFGHHQKWEFGDRKSMKIWKKNEPLMQELKLEYHTKQNNYA